MRATFTKNPFFAVVVIVGLAAGTVLLAGYVDKPSQATAFTPDGKCTDCPREGTPACCKIAGSCQGHQSEAAATSAQPNTCGSTGCCPEKAQAPSCSGTGCGAGCAGQMQGSCGAGGCADTK